MKRIFALLAVTVLLVASALPALAAPPPTKGQFTCYTYFPQYTEVDRVPRGQVAEYERAGYSCYRSGQ
jgi:hypothetical protein